MHDEMREPTEEEYRAALEEQMRNLRVDDVILQTVATLVNLGGRRLGLATAPGEDASAERDLDQARTAIEAVRALAPHVPSEQAEALRQAMSQLQLAYAREAGGQAPPTAQQQAAEPGAASAPPPKPDEEAERAKARSKIWTPGGSN
jgi:hypothetical protein